MGARAADVGLHQHRLSRLDEVEPAGQPDRGAGGGGHAGAARHADDGPGRPMDGPAAAPRPRAAARASQARRDTLTPGAYHGGPTTRPTPALEGNATVEGASPWSQGRPHGSSSARDAGGAPLHPAPLIPSRGLLHAGQRLLRHRGDLLRDGAHAGGHGAQGLRVGGADRARARVRRARRPRGPVAAPRLTPRARARLPRRRDQLRRGPPAWPTPPG